MEPCAWQRTANTIYYTFACYYFLYFYPFVSFSLLMVRLLSFIYSHEPAHSSPLYVLARAD